MSSHPSDKRTCPRCGIRKTVNTARWKPDWLCVDCKSVEPRYGRKAMGRPPKPVLFLWASDEQIKAAHSAWTQGFRSPRINEGHRLYMREHKRRQRAVQRARTQRRAA